MDNFCMVLPDKFLDSCLLLVVTLKTRPARHQTLASAVASCKTVLRISTQAPHPAEEAVFEKLPAMRIVRFNQRKVIFPFQSPRIIP